jgi:queuine tRNA-ribosyltransferase
MTRARIEVEATDGRARAGTVRTARGSYATPAFMPVGTRGAVKALDSVDLEALGAPVVLANTYHLMLRPGADAVARLGGLHRFTGWEGHTLTDSGGYQVHSLRPNVDDDGVTFASVYDGNRVRLTPESAVEAQGLIGADIQMVLDVCATLPASPDVLRVALDRTAAWAARARSHHDRLESRPEGQALFGIVQGGTDPGLRAESAERTVAIGFDGYGIGGLSVGEPRPAMLEALAATMPHLPADRPRYLMGVGDPVGLLEAVALGVDQFDCVAPTRMARHGGVLTRGGRLNLRNAAFAEDDAPLEEGCECLTCSRWSRGYLRHLLGVGEPTAWRLVSIHNLAFVLRLMAEARAAIVEGRFGALRASTSETWATRP